MAQLIDFYEFLQKNKPNSADHYESGLRAVSKDMIREGIISKPLEEMNAIEFEIAVFNILHNDFFIDKNTRGKRMYSNSIKQYQCFLKSIAKPEDFINIEDKVKNDASIQETERTQIIKARIGQGIFRQKVIEKYENCIISGISDERLLIASHVKPWSVSNNTERLDAENGLLLNSLHAKMFSLGLITFEDSGRIQISSSVKDADRLHSYISTNCLYDLKLTDKLKENLEYHRDVVFVA